MWNLKERPRSVPSAKVASEVSQVAMSLKPALYRQWTQPPVCGWPASREGAWDGEG